MKNRLFGIIETSAKGLGFNTDELNEVAETVASRLNAESTPEEIQTAIDGVLPFLKLSQKAAQRTIQGKLNKPETPKVETSSNDDPMLSKIEQLLTPLMEKVTRLEKETVVKSQHQLIEDRLKEKVSPKFYQSRIPDKVFDDANEIESFISNIESEYSEIKKEIQLSLATEKLNGTGAPGGGTSLTKPEGPTIEQLDAALGKI